MTTIAFDGRYIACDSRVSSDGHVASNNVNKFFINDEWVLFWSGAIHQKDLFIDTFIAKGEFHSDPEVWLMGFKKDTKEVFTIYAKNKKFLMDKIEWIDGQGSGCCYAIGAMEFGASAIEAVKIAKNRDCATGGKINCLDTHTGKFIKVKQ